MLRARLEYKGETGYDVDAMKEMSLEYAERLYSAFASIRDTIDREIQKVLQVFRGDGLIKEVQNTKNLFLSEVPEFLQKFIRVVTNTAQDSLALLEGVVDDPVGAQLVLSASNIIEQSVRLRVSSMQDNVNRVRYYVTEEIPRIWRNITENLNIVGAAISTDALFRCPTKVVANVVAAVQRIVAGVGLILSAGDEIAAASGILQGVLPDWLAPGDDVLTIVQILVEGKDWVKQRLAAAADTVASIFNDGVDVMGQLLTFAQKIPTQLQKLNDEVEKIFGLADAIENGVARVRRSIEELFGDKFHADFPNRFSHMCAKPTYPSESGNAVANSNYEPGVDLLVESNADLAARDNKRNQAKGRQPSFAGAYSAPTDYGRNPDKEKIVVAPVSGRIRPLDTGESRFVLEPSKRGWNQYRILIYNVRLDPEYDRAIRRGSSRNVRAGERLGIVERVSHRCDAFIHVAMQLKEEEPAWSKCDPRCKPDTHDCYAPSILGYPLEPPRCVRRPRCDVVSRREKADGCPKGSRCQAGPTKLHPPACIEDDQRPTRPRAINPTNYLTWPGIPFPEWNPTADEYLFVLFGAVITHGTFGSEVTEENPDFFRRRREPNITDVAMYYDDVDGVRRRRGSSRDLCRSDFPDAPDFCIAGEMPAYSKNLIIFDLQVTIVVIIIPINFFVRVGGGVYLKFELKFCLISMKVVATAIPGMGAVVEAGASVGVCCCLCAEIKLRGIIMEARLHVPASVQFSKFPLSICLKAVMTVTPLKVQLIAAAKWITGFLPRKTSAEVVLWEWSMAPQTVELFNMCVPKSQQGGAVGRRRAPNTVSSQPEVDNSPPNMGSCTFFQVKKKKN